MAATTSAAFHLFTPVKGLGARTYCGELISRETLLLAVTAGGTRPQRVDVCPRCLATHKVRFTDAEGGGPPERIRLTGDASERESEDDQGTVLVVDDDAAIREELVDGLTEMGFRTASAANGREALTWLQTHWAVTRAVLLDLMMPEMDGLEFLAEKEASGAFDEIPVLVISAAPGMAGNLDGRVRALLQKPLNLEGVIRALRLCPSPRGTAAGRSRQP